MSDRSPAGPPISDGSSPAPDVVHLAQRRDVTVPEEDRGPLTEYWAHIRQLRAAIDERQLADNEIAVTWTAVDPDAG